MIWHRHRWKITGAHQMLLVHHYTGVHTPITEVLRVCQRCGNVQTTQLDGHWTLEQLSRIEKTETDRDILRKLGVKL